MNLNRYSLFVHILKTSCIVIVTCILFLLIIFINKGTTGNIKLQNNKEHITENSPATIVNNVSFFGHNLNNKEYNFHATQTIQLNQDLYKFIDAHGKYYLDLENKEYISITANEALVNYNAKYIDLITNVELIYSGGYRMLTEKISINFYTMQAVSTLPTVTTGAQGKIIANNGFILKDEEKTIEFFGPVTTILY